jgi:excisionase family DNA binding protein
MTIEQIEAGGSPGGRSSLLESSLTEASETLWTVEDVAGYLKLQPDTIRGMARRGELPAIKFGKVWRFQKSAIHAMLASSVPLSVRR